MYDDEIEKIVLNAIIFLNKHYDIAEDDFVDARNKIIAKTIVELKKYGKEASIITISNQIKGDKSKVINYIGTLGDKSYMYEPDEAYETLIELSKKRKIYSLGNEVINNIANEDSEVFAQRVIKSLNEITTQNNYSQEKLEDQVMNTIQCIENNFKNKNDTSLYTGIFDLDRKMLGLHGSETTIIGARPATGKTTLALQIAKEIATKGKNVVFVSLEMSDTQLIQKIISSETNIGMHQMRRGNLEDKDFEKISEACEKISKMNLKIITKIRYIQSLEVEIRKLYNQNKVDALMIDYIQLLKSKDKYPSREQEVADISRRLKLLGLELNIPVIALCQLNRTADNAEPSSAELRESGSLEQDADNVLLLYKEDVQSDIVTIKIAKQRFGEEGKVEVKFLKGTSRFVNIAR